MKPRHFILFAAFLTCAATGLKAQYDVHFSQYWAMENFYNPAAMNRNSQMNITAAYSMQFAGYTRAPGSMFLGANTVLPWGQGSQSGGVCLFNENIGLFSHRRLFANYAYKFNFGKFGSLNIGAMAGLLNESFNSEDLDLIDPNDPAFPTGKEDGSGFDLGAGLLWQLKEYWLGLSAQHLTSPTVTYGKSEGKTAELRIDPSFYLMGGCNIVLPNPLLSIQPSFQVATDLGTCRVDLTARGTYEYQSNRFSAGISYSPATSVTFFLGGQVKQVTLGYSYEMYTNGAGWLTGSHDLVIGYRMDVDFFSKGKNVHKSVRYL